MSQKIKIAKPTFDAGTETNPDNLTFSSDYNTLKYYVSGSYQMVTSTTTTVTIAHNLGYTPFFVCYVNQFDVSPTQYALAEYFNLSAPLRAARAYVDATNLYLSFNTSNSNTTVFTINWYYKLFKNNLGL